MLSDLDLCEAFVIYGTFSVSYSGRGASELEKGQYLIIHKVDGSLLVHGSTNITARNYQGAGSRLMFDGDTLVSRNKKGELISIKIHNILSITKPRGWSSTKTKMSKRERDLVNKIVAELDKYITNSTLVSIEYETTTVGRIDIYLEDAFGQIHVVEVKRGKASLAACSQVARYLSAYPNAIGYLMAPEISKNAERWCLEHDIKYIQVSHE